MKNLLLLILLLFISTPGKINAQSTNCNTATNLTLNNGTVCVGGNSGGAITNNMLFGSCNSFPIKIVWYTYVSNGSNNSFTITPGSLTNAQIIIYVGGCPGGNGTFQNCVIAFGSAPLNTSWGIGPGVQVWIGVASNNGLSGTFNLCINSQQPPPNSGNSCSQAIPVCSTPFTHSTMTANSSGQTPTCFLAAPQRDVWLKFTITQSGLLAWKGTPLVLTSEYDWALWDITGGCPGTLVCCNYNYAGGSSSGFGMQAQTGTVGCGSGNLGTPAKEFCPPINVNCGSTYAIQVSNYLNNSNGFTLDFPGSTCLITSNTNFAASPQVFCFSSITPTISNLGSGICNGEVWNYGDGSPNYIGLTPPNHTYNTPGTYAITATFGGICPSTTTKYVQLFAPLAATVSSTPLDCPGICNGSATITSVTGGDGVYTYLWSPGNYTTTTVSGLCSGIYSIVIFNAICGSSITKTVSVNSPPPFTLTANPSIASCGTNNGIISVIGSGGTPPYSYAINGGAFSAITNYTGLAPGTHTVSMQDSKLCQKSVTVAVTQATSPIITVNSATACTGTPVTLTAAGGTTYSWSPSTGLSSSSGNAVIATLTTTTIYTVTGTTGNCSGTNTATIAINPLPTPSATVNNSICVGGSIIFTGSGGTTYTWTGPANYLSIVQNPTITNVTSANSGVYTLTVKNANGCINSATISVTVNSLPIPIIGSNSPVCINGNINLNASGGSSYLWSGPNSFATSIQNPTISNASAPMNGVYTLTVTNTNNCKNTATVNVNVTTATTSATNTGPYCVGTTIQLNAPSASSYTWSGPNSFTSNLQNPTISSASTTMTGVYNLIVSIGSCTAAATTSVTVNSLPTPTASNSGPYCAGANVQLNVNSAISYTWTGPNAFTSNLQNPTITNSSSNNGGIYTVSVTNANGCINSSTASVIINSLPTPIIGSNSPVCVNANINLTANGGTSYSWSGPNLFTSAIQNPTITNSSSAMSGIYTVTVTNANGCIKSTTINVAVISLTTTATNTGPFCEGATIQLNTPAATSYTWSGPNSFISNLQNPTISSATTIMAGVYSLTVSIGSCTAAATTSVTVNTLPTPTASNGGPYCVGATIQLNINPAISYTWTGPSAFTSNSQNPTITNSPNTSGGIYTVSVTNANGCVNSSTTSVVLNSLPVPIIGSNNPVCVNANINLTASGGTSYSWSGPNLFTSAIQNPTITNSSSAMSGIYTVTVTNANGCIKSTTVNVAIISPTTTATNTGPFCEGTTIQLNTPIANSYTWNGPNGFISNLQNPVIVAATTTMTGVYNLTVSIGSCTAAATTSVTVNALPTPTASNNGAYCAGSTVQLNVNSAISYTWTGPNGFTSNLQNPTIINSSLNNGGVYTVSVTNTNSCVNSSTTSVIINALPTPIIGSNSPVCLGLDIYLTSNGGTSYSWSGPNLFTSAIQNPTITNSSAAMSGIYTVTVTNANGCIKSTTVNVAIISPTTTATNTGPYCEGATIQLNTPAGITFTWTGPNSFNANNQNPTISGATTSLSGVYDLTISIGSCTSIASTNVIVNALPAPSATNNGPYCVGSTIQLNVNSAITYTWTGPNAFTSNLQNPTVANSSNASGGIYTVSVTNANGCVNSSTTSVVINPLPVAIIGSNSPICLNSNINLTSSGGSSYLWSGPNSFTSSVQNPTISTASVAMGGIYTVTVTNANGCNNSTTLNVVITTATTTATNTGPYCTGSNIQLNTPAALSYTWTGPNGFISNLQNPFIQASSINMAGTYSLIASIGSCTSSASTSVIINSSPTPTASNTGPYCEGSSIQLNVNAANTYTWAGPNAFSSNSQNPTISSSTAMIAGIYTVVVTNTNGCFNSSTTSVVVSPIPVVAAHGATVCFGAVATLSATGGNTYSWTGPNGYVFSGANAIIPITNNSTSGAYTVIVMGANSCTNSSSVLVDTYPLPIVSITATPKACVNSPVNLEGVIDLPNYLPTNYTYQWSGPGNFSSTKAITSFTPTSMSQSGIYTFSITDSKGCTTFTTTLIIINPSPNASIFIDQDKKCVPSCSTFSLISGESSSPIVNLSWLFNGETFTTSTLNYCATSAANYTVKANFTDENGCSNSSSSTLRVYDKPLANFYFPSTNIEVFDDVKFIDESQGTEINHWSWHFINNNGFTTNSQNPTYAFEKVGNYPIALVVTNKWGCADTVVKMITISENNSFYVPNAFTPNGDGKNDIFYPKGNNIVKYEMIIFDRWGEQLFYTTDFFQGWDGTYQGVGCKNDTYVWQITITTPDSKTNVYSGPVTIYR